MYAYISIASQVLLGANPKLYFLEAGNESREMKLKWRLGYILFGFNFFTSHLSTRLTSQRVNNINYITGIIKATRNSISC